MVRFLFEDPIIVGHSCRPIGELLRISEVGYSRGSNHGDLHLVLISALNRVTFVIVLNFWLLFVSLI